jgi:fibronectin-binding autotransporter adhesin
VNYSTTAGTAEDWLDFVPISGTLSIPAGELSGTLSVSVIGDSLVEGDESFEVVLHGPSNATLADPAGVGVILNDDFLLYLPLVFEGDQ